MLVELWTAFVPARALTEGSPNMQRCLDITMRVVIGSAVFAAAAAGAARADEIAQAAALWQQMRSAEPDTADFKTAQWKLTAMIGTTAKARHIAMATAMMDRSARPGVNEAAFELFGADAFDVAEMQRILCDPQRSFEQRELLKTCYSECRANGPASMISQDNCKQLVAALAERFDNLAGAPVNYGEQRLFVHLVSAVLGRYPAGGAAAPEGEQLVKALEKYTEKADRTDTLAAAVPVWLDLRKNPVKDIATFSQAARLLGHWDPLERLKAAAWLGDRVDADEKTAQVVLAMLDDIRDEVRAEAARVFSFARDYKPDVVVPRVFSLLTEDVSTVVQSAAAETLSTRAAQAAGHIDPLLAVLTSPARRLGDNRTSCILTVLAKLAPLAAPSQKASMVDVATLRLRTSPDGALALLEALGPDAASAVPAIKEYRGSADRFQKAYIDRHVLPAIQPGAATK
jgi:hypothetical protein